MNTKETYLCKNCFTVIGLDNIKIEWNEETSPYPENREREEGMGRSCCIEIEGSSKCSNCDQDFLFKLSYETADFAPDDDPVSYEEEPEIIEGYITLNGFIENILGDYGISKEEKILLVETITDKIDDKESLQNLYEVLDKRKNKLIYREKITDLIEKISDALDETNDTYDIINEFLDKRKQTIQEEKSSSLYERFQPQDDFKPEWLDTILNNDEERIALIKKIINEIYDEKLLKNLSSFCLSKQNII